MNDQCVCSEAQTAIGIGGGPGLGLVFGLIYGKSTVNISLGMAMGHEPEITPRLNDHSHDRS